MATNKKTRIEDIKKVVCNECGKGFQTTICPKCIQKMERDVILGEFIKNRVTQLDNLANSQELHTFLGERNCAIVGCFYGREGNDYCVCCGWKRPEPLKWWGRGIGQ